MKLFSKSFLLKVSMKHKVALSGSYSGGNTEKLLKELSRRGMLQLSLVGREITLQVRSDSLDDIKKSLNKLGIDNINILEWKKCGITLSGSGSGTDSDEIVNVSLIPSTLDEGLRTLAVLCEFNIDDNILNKIESRINEILTAAGVTDAIYTIQIKKQTSEREYLRSVEVATLNALFDSGGLVDIE